MSFVDPIATADPITGTKATAALLNVWRGDMEYLHGPVAGCRVRTNVATALGGGGQVPFELEDYDNGACHSTSSNTTRITVPSNYAGVWWFGFCIRTTATATFSVCLNGTFTGANVLTIASTYSAASHISSALGFGTARLAVGDYIELRGNSTISTVFQPVFWAMWRNG